MFELRSIDKEIRKDVINLITENWCDPIVVTKWQVHSVETLPGFVVIDNNKLKGLLTYSIENDDCEIVSLDSLIENQISICINAIQESRKIEPQIPLHGMDNIPILHEIAFEKVL